MRCVKVRVTFFNGILGTTSSDPEAYEKFIASRNPAGVDQAELETAKPAKLEEDDDEDDSKPIPLTIFSKFTKDGTEVEVPGIWDYQVRGFFKEAFAGLLGWTGSCLNPTKQGKVEADDEESEEEVEEVEDKPTKKKAAKKTTKKATKKGNPYGISMWSRKKVVDNFIFVEPRQIDLEMPEGTAISKCVRPLRADTMKGERIALAASEEVPAGTKAVFTVKMANDLHYEPVLQALLYGKYKGLGQWRNSGRGAFTLEILKEWEETGETLLDTSAIPRVAE